MARCHSSIDEKGRCTTRHLYMYVKSNSDARTEQGNGSTFPMNVYHEPSDPHHLAMDTCNGLGDLRYVPHPTKLLLALAILWANDPTSNPARATPSSSVPRFSRL